MIEVELNGGLGNQMFQYALGRSLSFSRGLTLLLNASKLGIYGAREFGLDKYSIRTSGVRWRRRSWLDRKFRAAYTEQSFSFDPEVLISTAKYYSGYWQSYRYFDNIKEILIAELRPKSISPSCSSMAKVIECSSNSIGVHVRRGDYVSDPAANRFHGILGMDYYKNAFSCISKDSFSEKVFCFTDDPEWAVENFLFPCSIEIVEGMADYEDMFLLSKCTNKIIANSTFSWWAAYLGEGDGKIVAPREWFANRSIDVSDLLPPSWIRI